MIYNNYKENKVIIPNVLNVDSTWKDHVENIRNIEHPLIKN